MQKAICEDKESDKEQLKPCPFCGGMAEMLNYFKNEWLMYCPVCQGMFGVSTSLPMNGCLIVPSAKELLKDGEK